MTVSKPKCEMNYDLLASVILSPFMKAGVEVLTHPVLDLQA